MRDLSAISCCCISTLDGQGPESDAVQTIKLNSFFRFENRYALLDSGANFAVACIEIDQNDAVPVDVELANGTVQRDMMNMGETIKLQASAQTIIPTHNWRIAWHGFPRW